MRTLLLVALMFAASAAAHDLITAEAAQRYLENAAQWHATSQSAESDSDRAEALVRIGAMLDEIRELLNRDLAIHGEVQGLPSTYLVAELKQTGTPLAYSEKRNYFLANSGQYREALSIGLSGPLEHVAKLRLLRGQFYDSFRFDPLQSTLTWEQLQEQIDLAQDIAANTFTEPNREEARFIEAFTYGRAAKLAPEPDVATAFQNRAIESASQFEQDYPESMRSAAMPVLRDAMRFLD